MDIIELKKQCEVVFRGIPVEFQNTGLAHRIVRPATEEEKAVGKNVTRDGKIVLGAGSSWKSAFRYAARPVLEEINKREQEKADKRDAEIRLVQIEANQFADFLREKFEAEFQAWKIGPSAPVPDPSLLAVASEPTPAQTEVASDGPPTTPAP